MFLDSGTCFGFWEKLMFLVSGTCFVPTSHRRNMKFAVRDETRNKLNFTLHAA